MKQRTHIFAPSRLRKPERRTQAFTLIELLIVIGLTAVLFTLLLFPLVSALRYTKQAQIVTAAQDAARITRERLTRELGSALFVFDGTSHPFLVSGAQPQPGDDRYTNFLDLAIPTNNKDANGKYTLAVAHAYAAKLDFVLPKFNENGTVVRDPTTGTPGDTTTGDPISYRQTQNGSAIISNPAYVFPLAAGNTMIRYSVGLKDPTKPYSNSREGRVDSGVDNPYILYRAQFQPYKPVIDQATGKQTGVTPNTALFATRTTKDANGNDVTTPELDDPDFFRYVNQNGATDVNWLSDTHAAYTAAEAAAHNTRVDNWVKISKPVIPGPNIDLILLPHNSDNTLAYDKAPGDAGYNAAVDTLPGVAHTGLAHDPVADKQYPIVNTSVTFRPATVSGDAAPGTTTDYGSQGLPTTEGVSGYGYVPTFYTATGKSWSLPFHVTLYPGNFGQASPAPPYYFATQISSLTDTSNNPPLYRAGDLLEYKYADQNDTTGTLVYDITNGYPLVSNGNNGYKLGGTDFVPLAVNPDTGTLNFGTPSLPNGPTDRNNRNWDYFFNANADTDPNGGVSSTGDIDLTKIDLTHSGQSATVAPPLTDPKLAPANAPNVKNAHIVPGGIRVTGPDQSPNGNPAFSVPYTEVNAAATIGDNQYHVDYAKNLLQVSPDTASYLSTSGGKITVVYDYQANMTLTDTTQGFSDTNPYLPMQVKLDYQTRDLINVSIGVRIYDISNNRAQVIPAQTNVKIGNSNRG